MKCKHWVLSLAVEIGCEWEILFGPQHSHALFGGYIAILLWNCRLFKCSWHPTKTALFCWNLFAKVWLALARTAATGRASYSAFLWMRTGGLSQGWWTASGQGSKQWGNKDQLCFDTVCSVGRQPCSCHQPAMIPSSADVWCDLHQKGFSSSAVILTVDLMWWVGFSSNWT